MAVVVTQNLSSVRVYLDKGVDENSNSIIATKTFSNIYQEAENQDILDVVKAIVALQKYPLHNLIRVDNSVLSE